MTLVLEKENAKNEKMGTVPIYFPAYVSFCR